MWNTLIFQPLLNLLLFLYSILGRNFGLAVIVFTVLVRLLTLPFTQMQAKSAKASQAMQPKLKELEAKYPDPKDRDKMAQEQMKLYKEYGVNPLGCLVPLLIQMPIWFGLYQAIGTALPQNPLQLVNLAKHIYPSFGFLSSVIPSSLIPLNPRFLWLDLGKPDPWFIIPILTAVTMWAQQKMMSPAVSDPQQQAMSQSLELTMPFMFAWITYSAASGLGLYFVATNLVGIAQQYFTSGWGALANVFRRGAGSDTAAPAKGKGYGRKKR
ncbi:MAG: Membrane protein insertase MisCA precursor [Chloroflexi bacterium ADurb.Bin180]|nr:MAG: Membrane protein insertase MisCA precursor [Chloroflexi bacterium ADurb.Bin180]